MLTVVILVIVIIGAVILGGWLKKQKEMDKNNSDGSIHPK
jgi:hypothetical protein